MVGLFRIEVDKPAVEQCVIHACQVTGPTMGR